MTISSTSLLRIKDKQKLLKGKQVNSKQSGEDSAVHKQKGLGNSEETYIIIQRS